MRAAVAANTSFKDRNISSMPSNANAMRTSDASTPRSMAGFPLTLAATLRASAMSVAVQRLLK